MNDEELVFGSLMDEARAKVPDKINHYGDVEVIFREEYTGEYQLTSRKGKKDILDDTFFFSFLFFS